jgi:hypothetical protein
VNLVTAASISPVFEFPFTFCLVSYLRFISVPVSARVMESGRWSFSHEYSAEVGYNRGMVR